jgi:hypothetical protein
MTQINEAGSRARASNQTAQAAPRNSQQLTQLASLAILGQVLLFASAWLLPIVSEYTLLGDNISELTLGRFGFIQTAAFLISGFGTLGLAYALRQLTKGTWGSLVGPLLVGLYGLGSILVALFPTNRIDAAMDVLTQSTAGMIHLLVTLISFPAMVIGMFILTRTFGLLPAWRSLMRLSVFFPAGSLGLLVVQGEGPLVGLLQRLLVAVISGWIILVALRIRRMMSPAEPAEDPRHYRRVESP